MKHAFYLFAGIVTTFLLIMAIPGPLSSRIDSSPVTAAEARKIIAEGNLRWGKARIEYDKKTFEKMLAPDFYVQLPGRKLTREEFIEMIATKNPQDVLTRFDATVLTVQPSDESWIAIIQEKVEFDNPTGKEYSLWITRDGWKKVNDQWVIIFSEYIGSEYWRGGEKPPFLDW